MALSAWIRNWKRSIERRWALYQALRRKAVSRRSATRPRLEALEDRWLLSAYVVTSTADDGSAGTLRDAINQVNLGNYNEIDFNIGTAGSAQTINLTSQLPTLTTSGVFINGLSQGGSGNTKQLITLNGSGAGSTSDGLLLQGSNCIVSGLIIEDFSNSGIEVDGSTNTIGGTATGAGNIISGNSIDGVFIGSGVSGVQVQGNYIGTDTTGAAALGNSTGVSIIGSANTIGGTATGAGNVISGNSNYGVFIYTASGVVVQGNYIGTDVTGANAVANSIGVYINGSNNTIGGTTSSARNVISGNSAYGLFANDSGVSVQGNYIGTDVAGAKAIGNGTGISVGNSVIGSSNSTIGGLSSGAGNVISGNSKDGVILSTSGVTVQGNLIGTDATGTKAVANSIGVIVNVADTLGGTDPGAGNVISGNTTDGVLLNGNVTSGVSVLGNSIGTNAAGSAALANNVGIEVAGTNETIGGTTSGARNVLSGNRADGVLLDSSAHGVQVQGNYIGTDVTGANAVGNLDVGVYINGSNNTIGGTTSTARNIISANSSDGVRIGGGVSGVQVQGNYIGTDVTGGTAVRNGGGVAAYHENNTIGGTATGAGNLISGNSGNGVFIDASGVAVQGNSIGTDATGTKAVANSVGIRVVLSNTIGGTTTGAGNLISGNSDDGIYIYVASGVLVQGNSIGTDVTGTKAVANSIGIFTSGSGNTFGGTTSTARNIISGNSSDGVLIGGGISGVQVLGNYIGTDATGTNAVANYNGIGVQSANNIIGGTAIGAGNVISGNRNDGVFLEALASGVTVQGNYIGTDLTGTTAVANSNGIEIQASTVIIGGAAAGTANIISGNSHDGVLIDRPAAVNTGVQVQGNYIGTDLTGTKAVGNSVGVEVNSPITTIGGTLTGASNVISGNNRDGVLIDGVGVTAVSVLGNYIGTNSAGTAALANSVGIELVGSNNTIGGTASGARNVISGNSLDGILIDKGVSGVQVQGNYVGTDVTGGMAVGNGVGIVADNTNNTIGGTATTARNIISGNSGDGVLINASGVTVQGNFIGTDVTGTKAVANSVGVEVSVSGNVLGGTASGAGNLISGNTNRGVLIDSGVFGVQVQGNYIGTNAAGSAALANSIGVEVVASNNSIGGTNSGARNIISGNRTDGLLIDSTATGVQVQGNYVGIDVTGANAVGNNFAGVRVAGSNNTIGGTVTGAGNVLSGSSSEYGLYIDPSASGVQVQGNYIGTDAMGAKAIDNNIDIFVNGSNNTIGGTVTGARNIVSGYTNEGVDIYTGVSGVQVQGNYIGTDVTGTKVIVNNTGLNEGTGINIAGPNNTIGGTAAGADNVISGNGNGGLGMLIDGGISGVQVQGNFIGTNAAGTGAIANYIGIWAAGSNDAIGGTADGAGNVISGNKVDGIYITGSGVTVQGNYIGTDAVGSNAVGNNYGIYIDTLSASNNTIGGASTAARNIISGNGVGLYISSGASGMQVQSNYIGTNSVGSAALANSIGIEVAGSNNTLGASYAVAPNVISGNSGAGVLLDSGSSGNQVLGSYIGTNPGGTVAMANKVGIEDAGSSNTIGGSVLGARNVISGNTSDGVLLDSTATAETMQGNYIGLNVGGNTALANSGNGVEVKGVSNTIGGNSGSDVFVRNYISGNGNDGVLFDSGASGNQVQGNFLGIGVSGTNGVGNLANAIEIASNRNTIGGTTSGYRNVISSSGNDGVLNDSTGASNVIEGNFVGTDYTGEVAVANSGSGIELQGTGNTVGGSVSGAGNIVSGNSKDGVRIDSSAGGTSVLGNTIGLNLSSAALANGGNGLNIASNNNTIGGTLTAARNIISGNTSHGILIASGSSGNQVQGNYLGTNVNGTSAVANSIGIEIAGNSNTVGGSVTAARNVISGNSGDGVMIDSGASGNLVEGDVIGVNTFANTILGNSGNGIEVAGNHNTLGASYAVAPNQISGNSGAGVMLDSGSSANQVLGSYIGTNANGTIAMANKIGVEDAGSINIIGGSVLGSRNIISGNTNNGVLLDSTAKAETLQGNYIGVNLSGSVALTNGGNGVEVKGTGNTIGGNINTTALVRNYISGNSGDGVMIDSGASRNRVLGNFIGIGVSGTTGVGNLLNGVEDGGSSNTIGGSVLGVHNYISGNSGDGVLIDSTGTAETLLSNLIGLNANVNAALANSGNGVEVKGTGSTIGGDSGSNVYVRNYISGNSNDGVLLDSGASGNQVQGNFIGIGVSGTNGIGNVANAIEIAGNSNTIGGATSGYRNVISGSGNDGVLIDSTGASNVIEGNYVGTDYTGEVAVANSGSGIEIQGTGNTVGGSVSGAGNLISGNSKDGVRIDSSASGTAVLGNTIGLNLSSAALANGGDGLNIASNNNTIGGTLTAARNIISGNSGDGILIASGSSGNQVLGNYLGTNVNGTSAVANSIGIEIAGNSNTVGGSVTAARNVISGNRGDGVKIDSGASGNLVEGDAIGVNTYANAILGNSGNGIEVAGNNNTLGASYAVAPNQISGNSGAGVMLDSGSSGNQVLGSYIGTNNNGTAAMANKVGVEDAGTGNTIGGSVLGARNIISGNSDDGVLIDSSATAATVQGNYIGLSASGTAALPDRVNGLEVQGNNNIIGGTVSYARNYLDGNGSAGLLIDSNASGNEVLNNFIGLDITGTHGVGNRTYGIYIAGSNNTIGGTASDDRNVISGNIGIGVLTVASNNLIQGNYVGTDYTGGSAVGNGQYGLFIQGNNNTVGGTASGARNIISGNSGDGVFILAGGNQVLGNYIGTNAAGTAAVANSIGIEEDSTNDTIGGSIQGAGNIISGNSGDGVLIDTDASAATVQGNYLGLNASGTVALANSGNGIEIQGNNNTIGGVSYYAGNFLSGNVKDGLLIDSDFSGSSGNRVLGNFIGLNISGTQGVSNLNGIEIAGNKNTIGGSVSGDTNVISGNKNDGVLLDSTGAGNVLQGNYVGTDYTGNNALANSIGIVILGPGNTLGGTASAARNLISGNRDDGVQIGGSGSQALLTGSSGNQVLGNYIGLDASAAALGNGFNGLNIMGINNTVGGTASGAGNLISANSRDGVLIASGVSGVQVLGNYIGSNTAGTAAVPNSIGIEDEGFDNTLGGSVQGAGNVISGNSGDGIRLDNGNDQVLGNFVGLNVFGTAALANGGNGLEVWGGNNTIGGAVSSARNFLSGNSKDGLLIGQANANLVLGNFIGLDVTGTHGVGNLVNGIEIADHNNTIGGTASGDTNIVSGNRNDGILIDSTGYKNLILGNDVGTDSAGANALANNGSGIEIQGTSTTLGGTTSAAGNIISGNSLDGVRVDSGATGTLVQGDYIGLNASAAALGNGANAVNIAGNNNTIGGTASGARNIISGNSKDGVLIASGVSAIQVLGNYIGTNAASNAAVANSIGIEDAGTNNTLGGSVAGAGNIISGNSGDGILLDSSASGTLVQGNYIGTNAAGNAAVANQYGIEDFGYNNVLGGTVSGARNVISGNSQDGVVILGLVPGELVEGNYIGTNAAGTATLGNLSDGIVLDGAGSTLGGTTSAARNVISGNRSNGVSIGSNGSGALVQGNYIGLDVSGAALGNGHNGVSIDSSNNTIGGSVSGAGNSIANNLNYGVGVYQGNGNTISRNTIFANGIVGISLESGVNNNIAAPTLSSVTQSGSTLTVQGSFTAATANVGYVLEFFANPSTDAEGKVYLGSLTVTPTSTGSQNFTFITTTMVTGADPLITATLTDAAGDTSAFSAGVTVSMTATQWVAIGPTPVVNGQIAGGGPVSGRITGIAADPKNADIVYLATAGGGIWKSTNATAANPTWTPLTDNLSDSNGKPIPEFMGAVAETDDSNGNQIVYAGTGEANNSGDSFYGVGVLVSKDGGSTWTLTTASGAFTHETVSKLVIDPSDPSGGTAYVALAANTAAGETGIWKTTNFGQTWTNTTAYLAQDSVDEDWTDVVIDPHTPSTVYAAQGSFGGGLQVYGYNSSSNGVYKSTDGGSTWTLLTNCPYGTQDGRIALALYDDGTTNELFVSISNPHNVGLSNQELYKMEKSTDGGNTFTDLTSNTGLTNYMGTQGYYDTTLAVDPFNSNYVYAGGQMSNQGPTFSGSPLESFDGGNTWHDIATDGAGNGPHTDDHAVAFDANGNLLDGDDGGAFRLNNPTNSSTQTWSDLNTNLNTTQFYGIAVDPTVYNVVYGGAQDNGTLKYTGSSGWTQIYGGDGGITRVDPANHNVLYQEYTYVSLQISTNGGSSWTPITSGIKANVFDLIEPYVLDASDNIYYGTNYLSFSNNQGASWSQIGSPGVNNFNPGNRPIDVVAVNPVANSNVVYVSAGGKMFVTRNAQAGGSNVTWTEIDLPPGPGGNSGTGSDVVHNSIAVDPSDPTGGTAYAVVNFFTSGLSGHVFKTTNFGSTWTDVSGNLPDIPVDSVAVSPDGKTVYIGTDTGVYSSNDGGTTWAPFGTGLPNAMVMEIEIVPSQNLLVIGTHGRGAWEVIVPGLSTQAPLRQPQQPTTAAPTAAGGNNLPSVPINVPFSSNGYDMADFPAQGQGDSLVVNLTGTSIVQTNAANNLIAPSLNAATLSGSMPTVQSSFPAPTASVRYVLEFFANPSGDAEDKISLGLMDDTSDFSNDVTAG